jgi:transcriptional regulator with XRE-family HTH domain
LVADLSTHAGELLVAIAAHFTSDQRGSARRTLRLEALGATATGDSASVTVHNISQTGLLLETTAKLAAGEAIELDLPEAGIVEARVAWLDEGFAGCEFTSPIGAAALGAAQLRGAPKHDSAPSHESFAGRFARLRRASGLTLAAIADRLGVSKPTVWAWEQGKARPVEGRLDALAETLGVARTELTPDRDLPRFDDSADALPIVTRSRIAIAAALGIRPERVKISVEL